MSNRGYHPRRRGAVFVFAVLIMAIIIGFAALVVDVGYLANARTELQRSADAAALAASWEYAQSLSSGESQADAEANARAAANAISLDNQVCKQNMQIAAGDIRLGYLMNFADRTAPLDTTATDSFNAVEVTVRRTDASNGRVPFFFARVFGLQGTDAEASATAALIRDVRGFRVPSDQSNIHILPFALDEPTWLGRATTPISDEWTFTEDGRIVPGPDQIPEVNLYPKGNGSPGNRGTVDIGSSNNSTADIARQILYGITPEDLAYHGDELVLDSNNELFLNGDTGISAGVKDELAAIKGQPRCIPIFRVVNGPGNNAIYTIVAFAGIRIMDVKLTGGKNSKRVVVQEAPILCKGVIPSDSGGTSDYVYSPVFLVR